MEAESDDVTARPVKKAGNMPLSRMQELNNFLAVKRFVRSRLDAQLAEVRSLMKLPIREAGISDNCSFAAAMTLCNLIHGIAAVLYTPDNAKNDRDGRFRELLDSFYPWEHDENSDEKSLVIVELLRNPLAYSFGILLQECMAIKIRKDAMTDVQLAEIEKAEVRPEWIPLSVCDDFVGYVVDVTGLYWGVCRMIVRLARDRQQMQLADKRLAEGKILIP